MHNILETRQNKQWRVLDKLGKTMVFPEKPWFFLKKPWFFIYCTLHVVAIIYLMAWKIKTPFSSIGEEMAMAAGGSKKLDFQKNSGNTLFWCLSMIWTIVWCFIKEKYRTPILQKVKLLQIEPFRQIRLYNKSTKRIININILNFL